MRKIDEMEIEKLISEIEEKSLKQISLINKKEREINFLNTENENLKSIIREKEIQINKLLSDIQKLTHFIRNLKQKHKYDLDKQTSEMMAIMEISKKIERQNAEIQKLEEETRNQNKIFDDEYDF